MPIKNKKSFLFLISFALVITSCSNSNIGENLPTATLNSTSTPKPTTTITATNTITPTITPSPTSTATATPVLPVDFTTPFPEPLQEIRADNIDQIREIARYGSPIVRDQWLSNDGALGIIAASNGVYLFDLESNRVINYFNAVVRTKRSLDETTFSVSRNGNRFAVGMEEKVEVWDVNQGKIFELFFNKKKYAYQPPPDFKISSDGKLLGVEQRGMLPQGWEGPIITLYELDSGQPLENIPALTGWRFYFSPNNTWFMESNSGGGGGGLYRISDWRKIRDVIVRSSQAFRGYSPDDKLLVIQDDNVVNIYQIEPWKLIRQISISIEGSRYASGIVFSPDSSKIGILRNSEVSVWEIATGEMLNVYPVLTTDFTVSNTGIASTISDVLAGFYQQLNIEKNEKLSLVDSTVHFQRETDKLFTSLRYGYRMSGLRKYQVCQVSPGANLFCYNYSDPALVNFDGEIYFLFNTGDLNFYEIYHQSGDHQSSIGKIHLQADYIKLIWLSPDQKILLLYKYSSKTRIDNIDLWDISTGTIIKQWSGWISHFAEDSAKNLIGFALKKICGAAFCGDDLIVYQYMDNNIILKNAFTNRNVFTAVEFDPYGNLIYSIAENELENSMVHFYMFDMETRNKVDLKITITVNDYWYFDDLTFSPDGSLLAAGYPDGIIRTL